MLTVQFYLVNETGNDRVRVAKMEQIPRVGDTVHIPDRSEADTVVRTVVWYPFDEEGDEDSLEKDSVYIVLGSPRR